MAQQITIHLSPQDAENRAVLKEKMAESIGVSVNNINGYTIKKKSIDARSKNIKINITANVFINENPLPTLKNNYFFKQVNTHSKKVIIIGAGPAGIFAALQLLELGIKPIILERGKNVRDRRRDLATLNKEGIINPESNYCFGEGGAGTYSDGKLYTRSNKRGNIKRVLDLFIQFGAEENIGYEAHPHIGTNKLPQIITSMRQCIIDHGGEFLFEQKVTNFIIENNQLKKVVTAIGDEFEAEAFILATGHSARDIFELLHHKKILIEAKPFALGVRIEHPQQIIDTVQYHCDIRSEYLPPASYSLVHQVEGKGVFSFCMCPGGIIAPASTAANELVVNGWSPSKRNNPYANSGMVVEINSGDLNEMKKYDTHLNDKNIMGSPLLLLAMQQSVEQQSYKAGGGHFVAPAQRLVDFVNKTTSNTLPHCSYLPGLNSCNIHGVLPTFISTRLAEGFKAFGKKMKGYFTNEALIVATESRTSSPVKIPRDNETLTHPQLNNLYPCGEGAGYAGGIVSAAMDGERCATQIARVLLNL
jgi:uncharacterized protein